MEKGHQSNFYKYGLALTYQKYKCGSNKQKCKKTLQELEAPKKTKERKK